MRAREPGRHRIGSFPTGPAGVTATHRCQNCDRDIEELQSGRWVDGDGLSYCQQRVGPFPPVMHQPMPVIPPRERNP